MSGHRQDFSSRGWWRGSKPKGKPTKLMYCWQSVHLHCQGLLQCSVTSWLYFSDQELHSAVNPRRNTEKLLSAVCVTVTRSKPSASISPGKWKTPLPTLLAAYTPALLTWNCQDDFQGSLMRCTEVTGYFISGFHLRISEYFTSPLVSLTDSFKCFPPCHRWGWRCQRVTMGAPTWEQTQPLSWGNSWHHAQCVLSKLISKEKRETSPSLSPEASLVNFTFFTTKRGIILRGNAAQPLLHKPALWEGWGLSAPAACSSSTAQWAPPCRPCPAPL